MKKLSGAAANAGRGPNHAAFFNAGGADRDLLHLPVHQDSGRLKIRHEAAEVLARNVPSHPPFLLGFSFTGVGAA